MKKVFLSIFLVVASITTTTTMQSCKSPISLNAGNVATIASQLVSVLGSKLNLTGTQSPLVSNLVTQFLKSKLGFNNLVKSDPTQYASKLSGVQNLLNTGLKGVLSGNQMTQFLGLKPKTNDAKNILSQLFY